MKFNKGDIITNKHVRFRVDDIVKNIIGEDCYFLVNIDIEQNGMRYFKIIDPNGKSCNYGEITWLCEQVDKEFYKLNSMKDGKNMTVEEMQEEINKLIPTPEQVLEAIDKKLNIIKKTDPITRFNKGFISGYNRAIDDICNHIEDGNLWDYIKTSQLSDFEIIKAIDFDNMIEDLQKMKKE